MTKALHISKKKKGDCPLSEREAAMATQDQSIKDSLSLVKDKFIVMSGKRGIVFHRDNRPNENLAERPIRLCEAIKESYTGAIVLTQGLISCPGALRGLGWTASSETSSHGAKWYVLEDLNVCRPIVRAEP